LKFFIRFLAAASYLPSVPPDNHTIASIEYLLSVVVFQVAIPRSPVKNRFSIHFPTSFLLFAVYKRSFQMFSGTDGSKISYFPPFPLSPLMSKIVITSI